MKKSLYILFIASTLFLTGCKKTESEFKFLEGTWQSETEEPIKINEYFYIDSNFTFTLHLLEPAASLKMASNTSETYKANFKINYVYTSYDSTARYASSYVSINHTMDTIFMYIEGPRPPDCFQVIARSPMIKHNKKSIEFYSDTNYPFWTHIFQGKYKKVD